MKLHADFLEWERATHDVLDFKRTYVDMAGGDLLAGLMLSDLVYWHLPDKNGRSRLKVRHRDRYWVACARYAWWDKCRLSPRQSDRSGRVLMKLGLVDRAVFKFNNEPTTHYALNEAAFLEAWERAVNTQTINPFLPKCKIRLHHLVKTDSPNGENLVFTKNAKTITESTETTLRETTKAAAARAHTRPEPAKPKKQPASLAVFQRKIRPLAAEEQTDLLQLEDAYSLQWVRDAICDAADHHPAGDLKYPVRYVTKILRSWENDGRGERRKKPHEAPAARQARVNAKIARFIGKQTADAQ